MKGQTETKNAPESAWKRAMLRAVPMYEMKQNVVR